VVPSDQEANTIVTVLQKGYTINERVLRPALVTVSWVLTKNSVTCPLETTQVIHKLLAIHSFKFLGEHIMAKIIGIDLGTTNSAAWRSWRATPPR
jgi:hypothetical protein